VITTTPKNRPEMVEIKQLATAITKGRTRDADKLPPDARKAWEARYGGTTLGRQELDAEELEDVDGALWVADRPDQIDGQPNTDDRPGIEQTRVSADDYGWISHDPDTPTTLARHKMQRTIVSVDPPGGRTEAGIIVAGTIGNHGYTLADLSIAAGPGTWGRRAVQAYIDYGADGIVTEHAYGGDMVDHVIITAAEAMGVPTPPIFRAKTKVGKRLRAEPVVALYQQFRWHHVGRFPLLESEQTMWVPDETPESPNRLDAQVHAATYLLISARSSTAAGAAKRRIPGR
jgi:phage terminase large subunit-like protein